MEVKYNVKYRFKCDTKTNEELKDIFNKNG